MSSYDFLNAHIKDIYGYAVNRTASTNDAEDLAQDILLAVMESFKRNPGVSDHERYMWKIAHNVYVDHVRKSQKTKNQIDFSLLTNILPASDPAPDENVLEAEQISLMKREISRLSNIRRKIVVMHYFEEKPLKEIAEKLSVPVGTVKWHLSGSRGEIEKGMNVMRTNGNLSMNPIKFSNISYCGNEDSHGGPQRNISSAIRQNILYAAYRKPQSVNEIADETGISPPYILEEIEYLMDFNFINEVESGKYQTSIVILEDKDGEPLLDTMYAEVEKLSKKFCEQLMEAYKKAEPELLNCGLYVPRNDAGFLRWTAFVQSVVESLAFFKFDNSNLTPHKDGHYVVLAHLDSGITQVSRNTQESPVLYYLNGPMINWQVVKYGMWRVDHNWVKRDPMSDYGKKHIGLTGAFRDGQLPFSSETAEQYKYLLDNGLIEKSGDEYILKVVFANTADICRRYKSILPNLKSEFEPTLLKLADAEYDILKKHHPAHVDDQLKMVAHIMSSYTISPLVLRYAVEAGFLPQLDAKTEKSASIIIGEFDKNFI